MRDTTLQWILGTGGLIMGAILGDIDGFLIAFLIFILCDYITGMISAAVRGELSSRIGIRGIAKKAGELILVIVANVMDSLVFNGDSSSFRLMAILFLIGNEGISILENLREIGVPIPQKIMNRLLDMVCEEEEKEGK